MTELKATGIADNIIETFNGNPSLICWYPKSKPIISIVAGTMKNFTKDIKRHSLIYLDTLLNLNVSPTEKSKINVVKGIRISLIEAYIRGRCKLLKLRKRPIKTEPTPR